MSFLGIEKARVLWRREWDLNPRGPKGHRLTVA